MRLQLEQLDLLRPWPNFALREGYRGIQVHVHLGEIPLGDVQARPVRRGRLTHRRLRKGIARKLSYQLIKTLAREAMAAGPEALKQLPAAVQTSLFLATSRKPAVVRFVERQLLDPNGLAAPFPGWVDAARRTVTWPCPPVTVAICTRDRVAELEGCLECLKQLDYPAVEILVVNNSADPMPTELLCEREGVTYVRVPKAGLSRARNAALAAAATPWIAFTDDDCRPRPNWLRELVRPLGDTKCRGVTGLVLPAQLENMAEIVFEIYGGLGRGYTPRAWVPGDRGKSRVAPVQTWRIGAGANMLLSVEKTLQLGGFDEDMGPGGVGGCGEDTDVFYKLLRAGASIHYNPRAVVRHFHRSSPAALRKQIYSYAVGHAAYHWRCAWRYRDYRSLIHLAYHLPRWQRRNLMRGLRGKTKYPFSLVLLEMRGTVAGPVQYTAVKAKRFARYVAGLVRRRGGHRLAGQAGKADVGLIRGKHDGVADNNPVRAA